MLSSPRMCTSGILRRGWTALLVGTSDSRWRGLRRRSGRGNSLWESSTDGLVMVQSAWVDRSHRGAEHTTEYTECREFHGLKHGLWWSFWLELAQRRRSVKPGNMVLKRLLWRLHIHTLLQESLGWGGWWRSLGPMYGEHHGWEAKQWRTPTSPDPAPKEEPATSCMPCRLRYQLSRNSAHPEGPRPTLHGLHSEEDPGQATADGRPTDKDSQGGRSAGEEHERVGQGSTSPSSVLAQLGLAVAAGVMAGGKGCYAMEAAGGSAGWDPERAIEVASLERAREVQQRLGQDADNDLAFAFESYADAMAAGGHPLASQWAVARGQAEASLSQAGAPAADDSGLGSPRDLFPKPLLQTSSPATPGDFPCGQSI